MSEVFCDICRRVVGADCPHQLRAEPLYPPPEPPRFEAFNPKVGPKLCSVLGLDPNEINALDLSFDPYGIPVVKITRYLRRDELQALGLLVETEVGK